jgi:hypothetical protein
MMWHIGRIDKIVATIIWNAKYKEEMRLHGDVAEAASAADEVIRKTQSRGHLLYMPSMYRGSGVVRAFTIFTSDLNQNLNLAFEFGGRAGQQPTMKNLHDFFWTFFGSTFVIWMVNNAFVPAVSTAVSAVDPDEPWDTRAEEFIKEFVTQFTGAIPFLSPLLDAAVAMGADEIKEARGLIPDKRWKRYASEISPAGLDIIKTLIEGTANKKPEQLFQAITMMAGYPYGTLKRAVKGVAAVMDEGPGAAGKMIFSDRALRKENIYESMARRLYTPRPDTEKSQPHDFETYRAWYKTLNLREKAVFRTYAKRWYLKNEVDTE